MKIAVYLLYEKSIYGRDENIRVFSSLEKLQATRRKRGYTHTYERIIVDA
jgi:hypothetical protein